MELDKRVKEGKTYLDCYDTEIAKKFIGKECYLSDGAASFSNIDNLNKATLIKVDDGDIYPYKLENTRWHYGSLFILPCEWVKPEEPEKKYRPYSLAEWVDQHEIGEVIKFRNSNMQEFHVMYLGYIFNTNDDIQDVRTKGQIMFVSSPYSLQELFEHYEICINGEWKPFGVVDEGAGE